MCCLISFYNSKWQYTLLLFIFVLLLKLVCNNVFSKNDFKNVFLFFFRGMSIVVILLQFGLNCLSEYYSDKHQGMIAR